MEWDPEGSIVLGGGISAFLAIVFLIAAGIFHMLGSEQLSMISLVGAVLSVLIFGIVVYKTLTSAEKVEKGEEMTERDLEIVTKLTEMAGFHAREEVILAGFLAIIVLYAALLMLKIYLDPLLIAAALVGWTVISVVWLFLRRSPQEDVERLRKLVEDLSEKVERLSKLLEE